MMNERISEQARKYADENRTGSFVKYDPEWFAFYNKKFAELMVKEFEIVAKQQPWYYDAPSCGWRNPINHVCNEIKQHLGVEE